MKHTIILTILLISSLLNTSCKEDFETSNSAEDFFHLKYDDYYIPVLIRGNTSSGKILLFVQGGPANNTMDFARVDYPGWINTLEKDYAIAYYEPRGMGNRQGNFDLEKITVDKYLEDIHQVATLIKKKYKVEVSLLGHSFGGYLTYRYMLKFGNEGVISKYISANGPATTDNDLELRWKFRHNFLMNEAKEEIAKGDKTGEWQEVLKWCVDHPVLNTEEEFNQWNLFVEERIYSIYGEKIPSVKDYAKVAFFSSYNPLTASLNMAAAGEVESQILRDIKSFDLIKSLFKIDQPILILTGRHDDVCPPEEAIFIMDNISSSNKTATIIPDAGHESFYHQPDLFRKAINAFIE